MTGRALAEMLATVILTVILSVLLVAVWGVINGESFIASLIDYAPRMMLGLLWPVYALWAVFLVIANLRNRARTAQKKIVTGVIGAIVIAVLYVLMWQGLSLMVGDGWGWVLLTVALIPTPFFLLAATASLLITHLMFFRSRPPMTALR